MNAKRSLFFLTIAASVSGAALKPLYADNIPRLLISYDMGGTVSEYIKEAHMYAQAGVALRIRGVCASSCTIFFMHKYNLNICMERDSYLAFHMPWAQKADLTDEDRRNSPFQAEKSFELAEESLSEWRRLWLSAYSPEFNNFLLNATLKGKIPNPSITGRIDELFYVQSYVVAALNSNITICNN